MSVRCICNLIAVWLCAAASLQAAEGAHTKAKLVLASETARAGDTVLAGLALHMDRKWHTYWQNPGSSGLATKIAWELPKGVSAVEIQWPLPKKLTEDEYTTYIYEDDVVLLVPLKLATELPTGPIELKAKVS